jgi:purine-nucleoside phosphorylase
MGHQGDGLPPHRGLDLTELDDAVDAIRARSDALPRVGVVLGSGLGGFADAVEDAVELPYAEIPGWPSSTAVGHAGTLLLGELGGIPVAVMKGRAHLYEGVPAARVVFGVRVLGRLGIESLVLTNACGAIDPAVAPGTLVAVSDHLNLQGTSPLVGPNDETLGPRFPDMSDAYDPAYRALAHEAAQRLGLPLGEGVYAAWLGRRSRRPPRSACCGRSGQTSSACRPSRRCSPRGTWASAASRSRA